MPQRAMRLTPDLEAGHGTATIARHVQGPYIVVNHFQRFIAGMDAVMADRLLEAQTLERVEPLMRALVDHSAWLAPEFARPHPLHYRQYLLHADLSGRYSVVSFVWGPGQRTPVHDHGTWGVIGMLSGAELSQHWRVGPAGLVIDGAEVRLEPGDIARVSPTLGDVHVVRNAFDDRVSISIHAYGADIGRQRRHVFDPTTGVIKDFVSGYSNSAGGFD